MFTLCARGYQTEPGASGFRSSNENCNRLKEHINCLRSGAKTTVIPADLC
jgi:hypothetical protein